MTLIGAFRHHSVPLTRAVVLLFAASWLGLAAQPCMAAAAHDAGAPAAAAHDCPHCPPPASDAHDCDHAVAIECAADATPGVATQALKAPDLAPAAGLAMAPLHAALADPGHVAPRAPPDPGRSTVPRTLQQRYCTYLK